MPKYKDQHGTTRVGDFLRSIGKSDSRSVNCRQLARERRFRRV
jgi:hypothetical protein